MQDAGTQYCAEEWRDAIKDGSHQRRVWSWCLGHMVRELNHELGIYTNVSISTNCSSLIRLPSMLRLMCPVELDYYYYLKIWK